MPAEFFWKKCLEISGKVDYGEEVNQVLTRPLGHFSFVRYLFSLDSWLRRDARFTGVDL